MFSTGQFGFAIFFVIAFIAIIIYSYYYLKMVSFKFFVQYIQVVVTDKQGQ